MINILRKIIPQTSLIRTFYSHTKAILANAMYGFPAKDLTIIGVTGTDGKTTTTEMIYHILEKSGRPVAKISSASFSMKNSTWENKTKRTTVSPFKMQKFLKQCIKEDIGTVVLEVSSHAIHQKRIFGIKFDIAVLTNISHEHLDYHKTIDNLRDTKKLLFTKYLEKDGVAILNQDDEVTELWKKDIQGEVITYGFSDKSQNKITHFKDTKEGISFNLKDTKFTANVFGKFNTENATAAILTALAIGHKDSEIKKNLKDFTGIKGRLENLDFGQDFEVFVDFAITPKALKSVLSYLKERTPGRVILVFGATGSHDQEKRRPMAHIARDYADIIVITDDETYNENGDDIRKELREAIFENQEINHRESDTFFEIADRKIAIEQAIMMAKTGDSIIISGMGSLESRNMQGKEIPWSDQQIIADCFTNMINFKLKQLKSQKQ